MSRYIDADAFYEDMCKRTDSDSWRDCWSEFVAILSNQPTADVVPSKYGCGNAPYCSDVWGVDEDE